MVERRRMDVRGWNLGVLAAVGVLWLACGIQREKPVLGCPPLAMADFARSGAPAALPLRALEAHVANHPADAAGRRALAQSYLDAHAPGLALRIIESASPAVRLDPELEHVHARALVEQGRSADALVAERHVLAACSGEPVSAAPAAPASPAAPVGASAGPPAAAPSWICASASRRVAFLEELVALGVEDAQAHPEASAVAYHNATREARLALQ
ncbi:hypothetical protein [Pendulispora albinea]|uniref:Uncharacterized protein n=1 Tax=Pendulispora albinea TaxID=2741071 RepID=A0ABZ2LU37_9BACT